MDDRKFTEKESLELITAMISNTRKRMELGSGNVLLAWGYVVTAIALTIGLGFHFTKDIAWYWLWFAIPFVGYPLHYILAIRKKREARIKTDIDRYMNGIWAAIGIFFLIIMAMCFIFALNGLNAWGAMYLLTLPCCGFGTMSTGIILKEKSLLAGGLLSMIAGGLFIICYICKINIFHYDIFIFAACFAMMMILPGHILNHKAKKHAE